MAAVMHSHVHPVVGELAQDDIARMSVGGILVDGIIPAVGSEWPPARERHLKLVSPIGTAGVAGAMETHALPGYEPGPPLPDTPDERARLAAILALVGYR